MAYDSDDICPSVRVSDDMVLAGADREDAKMHEVEKSVPEVPHLRPDDEDLYPEQPPPKYMTIARPPDFTAGNKTDSDRANSGTKTKQEKTFSPVLWVIIWGVGGGLALWLYFQLMGLFKILHECQGRWFWAAVVLFIVVPILALIWVSLRFLKIFRKLPNRKQVCGDLHAHDVAKKEELKGRLKPYIEDLRRNKDYVDVFKSDEDRQKVSENISRLCDDSRYSDAGGWMDDFNCFQKYQEGRAYEVVKTYCTLVALKTAACPWKAIDMIIVFVNLTLMVEKIARVYNRRVSRGGAFRLLCHWFANIYISGELGAITDKAAGRASDTVAEWLTKSDGIKSEMKAGVSVTETAAEQVSEGVADSVANGGIKENLKDVFAVSMPTFSKLVGKFVGKAAEGAINAYLAYRMGKRAIEEFQFFVQTKN